MSKKNKKKPKDTPKHKTSPNILFFVVDEERFPSVYENDELKTWRKENLRTQELLQENGVEFLNHYIGSTACSPSRTTLFTGQYPSLHGVTQTTGVAKGAFDPNVYWLDPNTVPTLGDYFRTAGYRTYWKGKWHLSDEDILIPGTHNALASYHPESGVPERKQEQMYLNANRLDSFGFTGWVGPEPHGSSPQNSGSSAPGKVSGRDEVYSSEVINLLQMLEKDADKKDQSPWLIVSSFVNPHDIVLYGLLTQANPQYNFEVDPSVPEIPPSPTAKESLKTKPIAQQSYRDVYQKALQPTRDTQFFRQLYYSLQKQADDEMYKVFQALKESSFYEDTIVIFTSDHGDLLGAHGGLFQKWYNAYEESLHVPLIIHSQKHFSGRNETDMLTSHVDIIPTLLGLSGINVEKVQEKLSKDHSEVHPLVGRDLAPLLKGESEFSRANEPLYFMTDDDVTRGLNQVTFKGEYYGSVVQPNHLESVITTLTTGENGLPEVWKLSRYFDNQQFWSNPGVSDKQVQINGSTQISENVEAALYLTTTKSQPVPDQYELYNLTRDPLEQKNLAHLSNATSESKIVFKALLETLEEQRTQKRLSPSSGIVPGMPSDDK